MSDKTPSGTAPRRLTMRRPDDWHVHFRDDAMLRSVVPLTARQFARAIVMPNLVPPVTHIDAAREYRDRIRAAVPAGIGFEPLMTCYLTDQTDSDEVARGAAEGIFTAVKMYPANATTNSAFGVTDIVRVRPVFERMQEIALPLLIHGEVTDPDIDIFDREAVFIDRVLIPLLADFPALKVVLEHITTEQGADFVAGAGANVAATITPHHLMISRNDLFVGGLRPHLYCLPVAKRARHRDALRRAATSGAACFFLGTDTAPHAIRAKESDCGCAGIFNAPVALECYAQVFDEMDALDRLESFASENGPRFYGLPLNGDRIVLEEASVPVPREVPVAGPEGAIRPFRAGDTLGWKTVVADGE